MQFGDKEVKYCMSKIRKKIIYEYQRKVNHNYLQTISTQKTQENQWKQSLKLMEEIITDQVKNRYKRKSGI